MFDRSGIIKPFVSLFNPPFFESDEEKTRDAKILNRLLNWSFALLSIPVFIGLPLVYIKKPETAFIIFVFFLVLIVSKIVMFKGLVRQASQFLVSVLWVTFITTIVLGAGMKDFRFILIISITVVAGMLLGRRTAVFFAVISAAAGLIIAVCEVYGYLPVYYFPTPTMARWIELCIALILTTTTLYLALKNRDDALASARKQLEERRQTEEKLTRSEERFSKAFHASPAPTVITTVEEGRSLAVNDQWCRMMGYSGEEMIGRTGEELSIWPYPEERKMLRDRYSNQGFLREELIHLRTKSGEIKDVLCSAEIIKYEGEDVILALLFDVTERKKADDALRRSEEKYRFLTEKMNDMIWTLDLNLKTTFVTPSVKNVLGYTPEERMRQEARDQMTPASYERVIELLASELQRENKPGIDPDRTITIEIEYYHKNGSVVWLENNISGIRVITGIILHQYHRDKSTTNSTFI